MRTPEFLTNAVRFARCLVLAARYYVALGYTWHLSWVKARGAR